MHSILSSGLSRADLVLVSVQCARVLMLVLSIKLQPDRITSECVMIATGGRLPRYIKLDQPRFEPPERHPFAILALAIPAPLLC